MPLSEVKDMKCHQPIDFLIFQLMLVQMEKKDDEKTMGPRDLHSTTPGQQ